MPIATRRLFFSLSHHYHHHQQLKRLKQQQLKNSSIVSLPDSCYPTLSLKVPAAFFITRRFVHRSLSIQSSVALAANLLTQNRSSTATSSHTIGITTTITTTTTTTTPTVSTKMPSPTPIHRMGSHPQLTSVVAPTTTTLSTHSSRSSISTSSHLSHHSLAQENGSRRGSISTGRPKEKVCLIGSGNW